MNFAEEEIDGDTCTENELNRLFSDSLTISSEQSITSNYILFIDSTRDFTQLAAAASDNSVYVYDLNIGKSHTKFGTNNELKTNKAEQICGIRYAPKDSNTLYVSTNDQVYLFDLRTNASPVQLFDDQIDSKKPLTCFDVNCNGKVVCVGTEQSAGEANLLFCDVRAKTLLATYTDSHRDDVTQVKFHPSKRNYLASGSTDGLINIFNTKESCEDDALDNCLNTESSIQTINWHVMQSSSDAAERQDYLACITDTNDFQLFDVDNCDLEFKCEREAVTAAIKRRAAGDCYLVNSHSMDDGTIFCLSGSNYNNGECLRSLRFRNKEFAPFINFVDNKQIVRCSLFNEKSNMLVTAGESGIVTLWESRPTNKIDNSQKITKKTEKKEKRKSKPY